MEQTRWTMRHDVEGGIHVKPLILPAGLALAAVAPGAAHAKLPGGPYAQTKLPTPAQAKPSGGAHAQTKLPTPAHARAYERAYEQVAHRLGRRAPGRNIVKDGVARNRPATDAETVALPGNCHTDAIASPSTFPGSSSAAGVSWMVSVWPPRLK